MSMNIMSVRTARVVMFTTLRLTLSYTRMFTCSSGVNSDKSAEAGTTVSGRFLRREVNRTADRMQQTPQSDSRSTRMSCRE